MDMDQVIQVIQVSPASEATQEIQASQASEGTAPTENMAHHEQQQGESWLLSEKVGHQQVLAHWQQQLDGRNSSLSSPSSPLTPIESLTAQEAEPEQAHSDADAVENQEGKLPSEKFIFTQSSHQESSIISNDEILVGHSLPLPRDSPTQHPQRELQLQVPPQPLARQSLKCEPANQIIPTSQQPLLEFQSCQEFSEQVAEQQQECDSLTDLIDLAECASSGSSSNTNSVEATISSIVFCGHSYPLQLEAELEPADAGELETYSEASESCEAALPDIPTSPSPAHTLQQSINKTNTAISDAICDGSHFLTSEKEEEVGNEEVAIFSHSENESTSSTNWENDSPDSGLLESGPVSEQQTSATSEQQEHQTQPLASEKLPIPAQAQLHQLTNQIINEENVQLESIEKLPLSTRVKSKQKRNNKFKLTQSINKRQRDIHKWIKLNILNQEDAEEGEQQQGEGSQDSEERVTTSSEADSSESDSDCRSSSRDAQDLSRAALPTSRELAESFLSIDPQVGSNESNVLNVLREKMDQLDTCSGLLLGEYYSHE